MTFEPGQTVGIKTGLQSVSGPWVGATGTVVRSVVLWRDQTDYIVNVAGEELLYPFYLLTEVDS